VSLTAIARTWTGRLVLVAVCAAPTVALAITFEPVVLAQALDRVTEIRHVPAAGAHSYVAEQSGRIRILQPDGDTSGVFLDLRVQVRSTGFEQGLTGLAFPPDFPDDPSFYVHYIRADDSSVVSRLRAQAGNPLQAEPGSEQVLLVLPQPSLIHNCNKLEFGPDGYLYIGCGDGGPGSDPVNPPRDLGNLYGKLLRIDVDNVPRGQPYGIPPDNPHVGTLGARPEIWASGLRNPYKFSFDPLTGDLWLGDVGEVRWEELNLVPRVADFGVDFGWNTLEDNACFRPPAACTSTGLWMPIHTYNHGAGRCAIVTGPRLRGAAYRDWDGLAVFGDFCSGDVFALRDDCGVWRVQRLGGIDGAITGFALGPDGELLVGTYGLGDAQVIRVARADTRFVDGFEAAPTCQ
jgi:glucose/arabinose dehydrogenase